MPFKRKIKLVEMPKRSTRAVTNPKRKIAEDRQPRARNSFKLSARKVP